jgi:hypothetical protein
MPNTPKMSSPLVRLFSYAVSGTGAQVGGISGEEDDNGFIQASSSKPPMQYVFDALTWTKQAHARHHSLTPNRNDDDELSFDRSPLHLNVRG